MRHRRVNQKVIILLVVLLMALALAYFTSWQRPGFSKIEAIGQDLLGPLENGVTRLVQAGKGLKERFFNYQETQQENEALRREVEELRAEVHILEEYRQENLRLRNLFHFNATLADQYQLLAARVIARNPSNWRQTLTIDRGKRHGLREGMAVITPKGVVGRIGNLGERTGEIVLILDHDGAVGGMVQNTRVPGIVEGTGDQTTPLQMIQLPYDSPVKENQTVITSGLGGIFPKGLRIGYVVEIVPEPNGLMKKALLVPFVDYDRIEEVLVIMAERGGE